MNSIKKIIFILLTLFILTGCSVSKDYELKKLEHYLSRDDTYKHPYGAESLYVNILDGEYNQTNNKKTSYIAIDTANLTYEIFNCYPSENGVTITKWYTYDIRTDIVEGYYWIELENNPKMTRYYNVLYNYQSGTSECDARNGYRENVECNIKLALGFVDTKSKLMDILNEANIEIEKLKQWDAK